MFSALSLVAQTRQSASVLLARSLHATSQTAFGEMKRQPLPKTTSIKYTIPTDPYLLAKKFQEVAAKGKLDDAVAIVMQSKARCQSGIVWNLVINAYAKDGRLSRALRAFTEMRRRGFKPTPTTFTALFKACALSDAEKSVQIAQSAYESMESHGVRPTIISVNSLLNVYLRKHNVDAILERFNELPAEGPRAPSLATYTIVLSALRRELQLKLTDLQAKPETAAADKNNAHYQRRLALMKEHVHRTFGALMDTWTAFAEDAERRINSRPDDTPLLGFDTHIANVVLKACHAVYAENRALGRRGLRVAEQIYGFNDSSAAPLALRISQSIERQGGIGGVDEGQRDGLGPIIDDTTVDLVLDLCGRDDQPTKAVRFWRSLEANFGAQFRPSKGTREKYKPILAAHEQRTGRAKKKTAKAA
ncbi:hypothetical protein LPJ56_000664 [Coemansia sp. RSA 2599]|nr:hypothetical protein LPJ75_000356 [Coemansia sp. RSA 2598]KAJ1829064.1 hypothetical protein LPJ56_000664 [Coemansia sp. RSA 2599]